MRVRQLHHSLGSAGPRDRNPTLPWCCFLAAGCWREGVQQCPSIILMGRCDHGGWQVWRLDHGCTEVRVSWSAEHAPPPWPSFPSSLAASIRRGLRHSEHGSAPQTRPAPVRDLRTAWRVRKWRWAGALRCERAAPDRLRNGDRGGSAPPHLISVAGEDSHAGDYSAAGPQRRASGVSRGVTCFWKHDGQY